MHADRTFARTPTRTAQRFALRMHGDLLLAVAVAVAALCLLPMSLPLVRVPLGLALVLWAPGYAVGAALFARRSDLNRVVRMAFSIGLSVATLPLLALLVDRSPWGLRPWPMMLALAMWVTVWCGVALLRRWALGTAAYGAAFPQPRLVRQPVSLRRAALIGTLCVGIGAGSLLMGRAFNTGTPQATELFVLGANGLLVDYPREAVAGKSITVPLGVTNHDGGAATYRVEVRAGDAVLHASAPITIRNGATWQAPLRFAVPRAGDDQAIDVLLLRDGTTTPYRSLRLWLDVQERS